MCLNIGQGRNTFHNSIKISKNMKLITKNKNEYILRFDRGDRWPGVLLIFAKKNKILGCWFSGFGAFKNPTLGFYDHAKDKYLTKKFEGTFEALSLTGNLSIPQRGIAPSKVEGLLVHNHVVLSDRKYKTIGGHLVSAEIGATLEVFLTTLPSMRRNISRSGFGSLV